jgi:hypothetical protein
MSKSLRRQILEPVLFYLTGFTLSWVVFKMTPRPYAHGLDFYSAIAFLTFFIGVIWAIKNAIQFLFSKGYPWTLAVHLFVLGTILIGLYIEG